MAQRNAFEKVSNSSSIYTALDDQAFQRIHLDSWSQLKWYVDFTQQDLTLLSPEVLKHLQDDITSIQRAFYGHLSRRYLSSDDLAKIQAAVSTHLTELVDTGETYFPDFHLHGWVIGRDVASQSSESDTHNRILQYLRQIEGNPATEIASEPVRASGKAKRVRSSVSLRYLVPDPEHAFFFHLARLLGELGNRLKRCQRTECNKVFLQERTTARFCSRECQSVTASAQYRAQKKKRLQRRKRKVGRK